MHHIPANHAGRGSCCGYGVTGMRISLWRGAIGAAGLLVIGVIAALAAAPAGATVFTATFTGTFAGAGDFAGLFGPTIDLAGKAFTATYRVDTGVPGINAFTNLNSHFFYSGDRYGGLPTAITASLTSNGHSVALRGTNDGFIWQENDATPIGASGNGDLLIYVLDGFNAGPNSYNASLSFQVGSYTDFLSTDNYAAPGHYHFGPGLSTDNRFAIYRGSQPLAYGSLNATDLVIRAAGVPEPAAWGLMFAGFALTGAMLRRRSSLRVVAA